MDRKKIFRIALVGILTVLTILAVFWGLPRLLLWFLPFVLAFLLAKVIEPIVGFLEKKCKIPRKIGAGVAVVVAIGLLGAVIWVVVGRLLAEANDIVAQSDAIIAKIEMQYSAFRDSHAAKLGLSDELDRIFQGFGTKLSEFAASNTLPALRGAFDVVKAVPSAIIFTVTFVLATFFMSSDRETIRHGLRKALPEKVLRFTDGLMHNVISALVAYVQAQLVIICITFFELTVGFLIIGGAVANYALLLALVISIIDAIPILGTGTVLIPWGIYALAAGDTRLGIMLLVLYLICLAVRQMTEPRLMAHRIGLHPLLILMVMYIGLRLIGIFGMILGPVLALVVKQLVQSGAFSSVRRYIKG